MIVLIVASSRRFCRGSPYLFLVAESAATKTKELKMSETPNQNQSGSVDALAQLVVDELRESGTRAWLGFPPPEEMEKFRAEKAERDFQSMKRLADAKERRREEMKRGAMEAMKRSKSV